MSNIMGDDGKWYTEVDCRTVAETKMAVLLDNGDRKEWFPKAWLEDWPDYAKTGTALILEDKAIEKHFV